MSWLTTIFFLVHGNFWVIMARTLANTDFYRKTFGHDDPKSAMKKKIVI
jgi:hypothetical protein